MTQETTELRKQLIELSHLSGPPETPHDQADILSRLPGALIDPISRIGISHQSTNDFISGVQNEMNSGKTGPESDLQKQLKDQLRQLEEHNRKLQVSISLISDNLDVTRTDKSNSEIRLYLPFSDFG